MTSTHAAIAEFPLRRYIAKATPEIRRQGSELMPVVSVVNLTEAPEDAVCSLVIDLMHYCDREGIDWPNDIVARAHERFTSQCKTPRLQ